MKKIHTYIYELMRIQYDFLKIKSAQKLKKLKWDKLKSTIFHPDCFYNRVYLYKYYWKSNEFYFDE